MSGRLTALYVFIGLLLIVGIFIPLLTEGFINSSIPNENSVAYGLIDFFITSHKFTFLWVGPAIETNLIFWLPDTLKDYVIKSFISFTYVPDLIMIPIMLIMALSLIYVVITLIPSIGG